MPRLRRPFNRKAPLVLLIVVLVIVLRLWYESRRPARQVESLQEGYYAVLRVVDGDTILVSSTRLEGADSPEPPPAGEARVRLLGIDTPETVKPEHPVEPWGPEATAFAKDFLRGGRVMLRLDRRRVDKYGRFLAYVYVGEKMLNEELVRAGLARVWTFPGDSASMERILRKAQDEARAGRRGIWSGVPPAGRSEQTKAPSSGADRAAIFSSAAPRRPKAFAPPIGILYN